MTKWMRQTGIVAVMECRLQMATAIWRLTLFLSALLAVAMTVAGLGEYDRRRSQVDALVTQRDELRQGGQYTFDGFQRDQALRAVRYPTPLSVVVNGLDHRNPQYWDFGPAGISAGPPVSGERVSSVVNADLDLEFILRSLFGMLALVAGFSSLAASRLAGPTKFLVSLPVRPSAIMTGGLAGATLAAIIASAAAVGSSIAVLLMSDPTFVSADAVKSLGLIWLSTVPYYAVLVGLGAIVALMIANPLKAVATIVVLWFGATTLASPVVAALADALTSSQSRALFEVSRNAAYEKAAIGIEAEAGDIVLRHLANAEVPSSFQLNGVILEAVTQLWDTRFSELRRELDQLEAGLLHLESLRATRAWWMGALAPGTVLRYAMTDLAGVGEAATRTWISDAEVYQRALNAAVFDRRPRIHIRVGFGSGYRVLFHDRSQRPRVGDLPEFHHTESTAINRLRSAAPSIAVLAVQGTIAWMAGIVIFCRRASSLLGWR